MKHPRFIFCAFLLLGLGFATVVSAQQEGARTITQQKVKNFDRWNPRYFQPGLTLGAQVGLTPTFIKDEVHSEVLPISLRLGYQIVPAFSLEFEAGHSVSRTISLDYSTRTQRPVRNTFRLLVLRPTGHMRLGERMDAYGGLILGYQHNQLESLDAEIKGFEEPRFHPRNGLMMSGFVGIDFALTPRLRLNTEMSYGLSLISTGVQYHLR